MTKALYTAIDTHVLSTPDHDMKGDVSEEALKKKKQFDFFRRYIHTCVHTYIQTYIHTGA